MIRTALFLGLMASPVGAQSVGFCEELWLSRNTVLDRAGQCFSTPLGQAVFDNSDCVAGDIRLNPLDTEIVRVAQDIEQWAGCAVDTDARQLSPDAIRFHARLAELLTVPVRADGEQGCIGYQGPPIPLHAGISTNLTVLGRVGQGQTLLRSHVSMRGGWEYFEVSDPQGNPVAHGWAQDVPPHLSDVCDFSAG